MQLHKGLQLDWNKIQVVDVLSFAHHEIGILFDQPKLSRLADGCNDLRFLNVGVSQSEPEQESNVHPQPAFEHFIENRRLIWLYLVEDFDQIFVDLLLSEGLVSIKNEVVPDVSPNLFGDNFDPLCVNHAVELLRYYFLGLYPLSVHQRVLVQLVVYLPNIQIFVLWPTMRQQD